MLRVALGQNRDVKGIPSCMSNIRLKEGIVLKTYYHVSNDILFKGLRLEANYGKKIQDRRFYSYNCHNHNQYLREMIWENYRIVNFADRPSRLTSIFLFDDINLALQYLKRQKKKYIYEVRIEKEAKMLKTDMTFIDLTVGKSINEIIELAWRYFSGQSSEQRNYEILCEGTVKIWTMVKWN